MDSLDTFDPSETVCSCHNNLNCSYILTITQTGFITIQAIRLKKVRKRFSLVWLLHMLTYPTVRSSGR